MATKSVKNTTKSTPVTSPKITTAWTKLVEVSTAGEKQAIKATLDLAREMKESTLSIRDIQKAIKATGKVSPFVKVSHVEGLVTMLEMQSVKGFAELPLAKQLSTACASYKLLGSGVGEKLPSLEVINKETASARKAKHSKAKAPKAAPKAKATNADTLKSILAYFTALNLDTLKDSDMDLIADIYNTIESKTSLMA